MLEPSHAIELLGKVAGMERTAAEPEAVAELVRLCGYLPLAVRIAGARLASKPHWRLAAYAARLQDEQQRLRELRAGDLEVRASFMLSYQALSREEQQAFRLLGSLDAPSFQAWVAAALLDCALQAAEDLVERLVDAQLVEASGEDATGRIRYQFHDLLRVFARDRLGEEPSVIRQAALERVLTAYLGLVERAEVCLGLDHNRAGGHVARQHRQADNFGLAGMVERGAWTWFRVEQDSLIAAVSQAHDAGLWELTWQLADALFEFFRSRPRAQWGAWEHANKLALDATGRIGDRRAEAYTLRNLAHLYGHEGRAEEFTECMDHCLKTFTELGDQLGTAYALFDRAGAYWIQGRCDDALTDFNQCLSLLRELQDQRAEAATLRDLGLSISIAGGSTMLRPA
jgi:tetratricopeptide (TPR) repeat protein